MQLIKCQRCTHIKVTGHRCGSPALRGEHFCYFHARMIKGVRFRVDSRVNPCALLEDPESIQVAIMEITTKLIENTIDWRRASLILRALQIAVRNARNVHFGRNRKRMVRDLPNWDRQWMDEHGETPLTKEELRKGAVVPPAEPPPTPIATDHDHANNHCHPEQSLASEGRQSAEKDPAERGLTTDSSGSSPLALPPTCHPERSHGPAVPARQSSPAQPTTRSPLPKPNPSLSPLQARQWRELRRVQRSLAGARRGELADLKIAFAFAGLDKER